jgi:hypothetical protein
MRAIARLGFRQSSDGARIGTIDSRRIKRRVIHLLISDPNLTAYGCVFLKEGGTQLVQATCSRE